MKTSYEKILGCLVGGAAGDAMGAATEIRSREQIREYFGGDVKTFKKPPMDTFGRGSEEGQITDDFSVAYVIAKKIAENGGKVDEEIAKQGLFEWSQSEKWFTRFAGPTTRANLAKLKGEAVEDPNAFVPVNYNEQSSNGGGMKSAPVALFSGGDLDKAIQDSITVSKLTHPNQIALSGAAAIAAATAAAMREGANLFDVVQAGIYGAQEGDRIGRQYHANAGASVVGRIKLAVAIGLLSDNLDEAIDKIAAVIGSGLKAAEAVPAVFGLMVAAKGDTMDGIYAGVNVGDDTDTVATMIGGILGALNGVDSMPADYTDYLEKQNGIELRKLAKDIEAIINK